MKPVIGITSSYNPRELDFVLPEAYANAVDGGGGVPILLPPMKNADVDRCLSLVDGVILTGGVDVDPTIYGEPPIPQMGTIDPIRDVFEMKLTRRILEVGKPVLGICRGCQVLNVAAGGSLWQDINTQVKGSIKHSQLAPLYHASHVVRFSKDSVLGRIFGVEKIGVNSFHHQGIKSPAPGLTPIAWAEDETVEAVVGSGKFTLGVQWHPEIMPDSEQVKLFKAFVAALI